MPNLIIVQIAVIKLTITPKKDTRISQVIAVLQWNYHYYPTIIIIAQEFSFVKFWRLYDKVVQWYHFCRDSSYLVIYGSERCLRITPNKLRNTIS